MKSWRSALAKTKTYYSGSFGVCKIIVYIVAYWPIRCIGNKMTKQNKQNQWCQWLTNALCGYPLLKLEIRDSCHISTTAAIFFHYNYFRQTIWRLASFSSFTFDIYLGTSWTQPTAEEGFTTESVSIQPGCRNDVTKI